MKKRLFTLVLGCMSFTVSQILLRIPLLNYIQGTTRFTLFYILNPLLTGILIAFSAGVFEEGFRFIFKRMFLKPMKTDIFEPIIFGLGHGVTEALFVLVPALSIASFQDLSLGIFERFLAIILHVGLSVVIWNGFQLEKKFRYLFLAILIHGSVNSLIPIFASSNNSIALILSSIGLIALLMVLYIFKSKKLYNKGRTK